MTRSMRLRIFTRSFTKIAPRDGLSANRPDTHCQLRTANCQLRLTARRSRRLHPDERVVVRLAARRIVAAADEDVALGPERLDVAGPARGDLGVALHHAELVAQRDRIPAAKAELRRVLFGEEH